MSLASLRRALALLAALAVVGCVADPSVTPPGAIGTDSLRGVLVVNEGLRFQDNSTLTFYDPTSREAVQDYFARQNPGLRLGDTGNDIDIRNARAYIVVSTSQNVEVVELPSGRSLGRIRIGGGDPRKLAIVDDSTAFVTLLASDEIVRVDPRSLAVGERIAVGPAPEGIATLAGRLFVANSGYGFYRRHEPKAGTISVIDARSGAELALLEPGPNPVVVQADALRGRIYVLYGMAHADSSGGIVAYDAATLAEAARWSVPGAGVAGEMALDASRGRLYLVDGGGDLARIDLDSDAPARRFVQGGPPSTLGYYGVGVSPVDGAIYASSVASYTLPGRVVVIEPDGRVRDRFDAGLNPSSFGFVQE